MKITVIWAWSWWLALSDVLAFNGNDVLVYARNLAAKREINTIHTSLKYLHGAKINKSIKATSSLKEALDFSNYILLAVPSSAIIDCLKEIKEIYPSNNYFFINAIKWLNLQTKKTMQQIIKEFFPIHKWLVSLLWPSFASEVVAKDITCISSVSENEREALFVQALFSNNYFRVYTQTDVIWAEFYSSMKNAVAIASWIVSWLGFWENSRASLIMRWLKEMAIIWHAMWAKNETFLGATWLWDLILTCSSSESRNFQAGYIIWKDDSAKKFLKNNKTTVEWLTTIAVIEDIAKEHNLELPILHSLYLIVYKNETPSEMLKEIMKRPLTNENHFINWLFQ